jgi:hypothetical protein
MIYPFKKALLLIGLIIFSLIIHLHNVDSKDSFSHLAVNEIDGVSSAMHTIKLVDKQVRLIELNNSFLGLKNKFSFDLRMKIYLRMKIDLSLNFFNENDDL